jgi:glycosyltransferase involved in cell wall biosynthesis
MRPIYFNGKFYAGGLNGVHRVADRLIREVDARLAELPEAERPVARLLLPSQRHWEPDLQTVEKVDQPKGHSQAWEQIDLPRRAADGVLVNLCNLAPVMHSNKLLLLHDAQFLFPDSSYPLRQRLGYRIGAPLMARTSRQVLTVSEYSRQMLDVFSVSPRAKTGVLANGADHVLEVAADPAAVARLGLGGRPFVVHIASFKRYKNSAVVFEAFARPELSDVDLVLVGPPRERLEAAGLSPPDRAIMAGAIDDAGLRALYEAAVCLVFPSRTEGFGLPPVEAMACGCPVVAAPAGAIPEVCGDAALYAGVDEPAAWAAAILRYRDDRALRARKVAEGQERAARYTWRAAGRRLFEEIMTLAS